MPMVRLINYLYLLGIAGAPLRLYCTPRDEPSLDADASKSRETQEPVGLVGLEEPDEKMPGMTS